MMDEFGKLLGISENGAPWLSAADSAAR